MVLRWLTKCFIAMFWSKKNLYSLSVRLIIKEYIFLEKVLIEGAFHLALTVINLSLFNV